MTAAPAPVRRRLEFAHLDGLRGLAAVCIVLLHAMLFTGSTGDGQTALGPLGTLLAFGVVGVPVFIVLSGYVLALPVVREPDLRIPGGTLRYLRRRARRILPPYWAALALSLALIAAVPLLQHRAGTQWDSKVPVTPGAVVSHLFLVHDLDADWIGRINGPLWSVAVEWHLYFLLPLVLLPLARRIPLTALVLAAFAVPAVALELPLPHHLHRTVAVAHPWLLGLFTAGLLAARLTLTGRISTRLVGAATLASAAGLASAAAVGPHRLLAHDGIVESWAGLTMAGALVWAGRAVLEGRAPWPVRALRSRIPMTLGLVSYSVYLLHSPLLALTNLLLLPARLPALAQWALLTFVAAPLAVAVCCGFWWCVERRFTTSRQRHAVTELGTAGPPVAGLPAAGLPADGARVDGARVDGAPVDGAPVDGDRGSRAESPDGARPFRHPEPVGAAALASRSPGVSAARRSV